MNNFDKYIYTYLNESIIDIPRNSLDTTVFQFSDQNAPVLHPLIKTQIMQDIEEISQVAPVTRYFIVGSILTRQYTPKSDIDVNVQIDSPDDQVLTELFPLIKRLNGKMAGGTTHPINYFIMEEDYDLDKTEAAYDVKNEIWIKEPKGMEFNVEDYIGRFENKVHNLDFSSNQLRRHIIDLEELKDLDESDIKDLSGKIEQKMGEIETSIERLISTYKNVKSLRKKAFDSDMSPDEIRKYGHKTRLPENVIYKMLERYYYFDFIKQLKKVMEDGEVSQDDIKQIKRAGKDFWK